MLSGPVLDRLLSSVDACPYASSAGHRHRRARLPLYTVEERARRDATRWTLVQGILAPLQFLVFLVSLALVLSYLATGEGLQRPPRSRSS